MKAHTLRINEFFVSPPGPSDLHSDNQHPTPRIADELRKLIQLFDDVLLEGYSDNHNSLFLPDYLGCNPACNYCGTSLFLSYFDCAGVCFDLEIDSAHTDMSIKVCGTCYVEGRFCACRNMTPRRLHNFSDILRERNNAVSALSNYLASRSVQTDDLIEISER